MTTVTKLKPMQKKRGSSSSKKGSRKTNLVLVDVSPDPLPTKPKDWEDIKVGSLVLAWDREYEAWYEVVVVNEIDGGMVRVAQSPSLAINRASGGIIGGRR
jgi:hypothetical protein